MLIYSPAQVVTTSRQSNMALLTCSEKHVLYSKSVMRHSGGQSGRILKTSENLRLFFLAPNNCPTNYVYQCRAHPQSP